MKIGEVLKNARISKELSLRQIETRLKGKGINYTHTNIKRIEDGEFEKVPVIVLNALAEIYNLDKIEVFNMAGADLTNDLNKKMNDLSRIEKKELNDFLNEASFFFNDETVNEEDKEKFLIALQEMFFKAKFLNKK